MLFPAGMLMAQSLHQIHLQTQTTVISEMKRTAITTIVVVHGSGQPITKSSLVTFHYKVGHGTQVFVDTTKTGLPFTCKVGEGDEPTFITHGLIGLKQGGARTYFVPKELIKTKSGFAPAIPPNTDLEVTVWIEKHKPSE